MAIAAQLAPLAAAESASPAAPYQDRIIASDALAPLPADEADAADDSGGLPRSLRLEMQAARREHGDEAFDEYGVSSSAYWETATLGNFSFDATVFHRSRDPFTGRAGWGGAATLWQRNLFVDGGWHGDNGLGVLNTPALDLQRNQYRFFLPTVPMAGASTQWTQDKQGTAFYAAIGRAGLYGGSHLVGFDAGDGAVAAFGSQWQWAPGWTGEASYLGTHGRIVPDGRGSTAFVDGNTRGVHVATRWDGARDGVQFNLVGSDTETTDAQGLWIDASARRGRYRHHYGVFSLDPDLAWGALPINNDLRGGYYRIAYQFARWQWNAGFDEIRSISGRGFDGEFGTGFMRYQATTTLGLGGSASARTGPDLSYALQLFADKTTAAGQTRWQYDRSSGNGGDSWFLSLDQAFALHEGQRLSATVGYGQLAQADQKATATLTAALYGGIDLTDTLSLNGNTRWTHGHGPGGVRGTDIDVSLDWHIAPRWSLAAAYYQSSGTQRSPFVLDPLASDGYVALPRDRSVFVSLRFDQHAGRGLAVLGGAPDAAVGGIAGTVFLDDNNDGVRGASELPATNLTVVLDGRYSVQTDSQGRFAFPRVAVGVHRVTVLPDNLPLPWSLEERTAQPSFEVHVRQTTQLPIPAQRPR
jgi:hypothetical protein